MFSTIDINFCKDYLRIDEDFTEDDRLIELYLQSAKQYVLEYTERTEEELDELQFVNLIVLKMVSDFYTNKSAYSKDDKQIDPMLQSLLSNIRKYNI